MNKGGDSYIDKENTPVRADSVFISGVKVVSNLADKSNGIENVMKENEEENGCFWNTLC